ncbi:uncharacterized protein A4U43_C07F6890 [Asparagus officinalis]|uniref:alanine--glyoxylate transaminase n=1 Tax=Asparagus officinalis TaxID=4686 RepID=A0A5P1EA30_ASPOF|nr:uncharacterized protein A4U43_C07F6890 [Asparagus officinalis]
MATLNSSLPNSISPSADLRRRFKRKISSCLVSEKSQEKTSSPSISWKAKEIIEMEAKYLVGTYARAPVAIERGNGCRVYDADGREYLDMAAGIAVNSLGHCDPDLVKVLVEQGSNLWHVSNAYYSLPQVELAKRLVECSFSDRVFFTNSGTEANEAAIKFARKFQRHLIAGGEEPATEFISFSNSFHGRTIGSVALTSKEHYRIPFEPVMPGVTFLEYGDIEAAMKTIVSGKTAAVFVEPIQGEGGIYSATKDFLQALRTACDDNGALLIFDEVQCGLGRTGHLWAHEAYGIIPDIMTLAKPLAGGLPIGACLTTERVAEAMNLGDHGSTFAGSPLVCKVALKALGDNPHVKEVRGLGLIVGIELDVSATPLVNACRQSGLLVLTAGKGNVIRLVPPLIISEEELEYAAEVFKKCMPALDAASV